MLGTLVALRITRPRDDNNSFTATSYKVSEQINNFAELTSIVVHLVLAADEKQYFLQGNTAARNVRVSYDGCQIATTFFSQCVQNFMYK